MINNKAVALATLNWLGTKVNENKIQDILFPPEIDSVWLKSIFGHHVVYCFKAMEIVYQLCKQSKRDDECYKRICSTNSALYEAD